MVQVHVKAISWGFKSLHPHQSLVSSETRLFFLYEVGVLMNDLILKLDALCRNTDFDKSYAEALLRQISVNEEYVSPDYGEKMIFLCQAARHANVEMVKLLLQFGADVNLVFDDGSNSALWELQYPDLDNCERDADRLMIAKLLLDNGADPHIEIEGEDLYYWATQCHIELDDDSITWDYREAYICLLEAYMAP